MRTGFVLWCENWDRYDCRGLLRALYYKSGILGRINYMVIRMVKHLVALALVL